MNSLSGRRVGGRAEPALQPGAPGRVELGDARSQTMGGAALREPLFDRLAAAESRPDLGEDGGIAGPVDQEIREHSALEVEQPGAAGDAPRLFASEDPHLGTGAARCPKAFLQSKAGMVPGQE